MKQKTKILTTKVAKLTKPVKITERNLSTKNIAILFMEIEIAEWKPDLTVILEIGYEQNGMGTR